VTIERRDGKQFTVAISTFSQADQAFIRNSAGGRTATAERGGWSRFAVQVAWASRRDRLAARVGPDQEHRLENRAARPGASSRSHFGDHVYVTCYTGYFIPTSGRQRGTTAAAPDRLRLSDGQILWDKPSCRLPEEEQIRDHGYAASTPAADAERVYVFFASRRVRLRSRRESAVAGRCRCEDQRLGLSCIAGIVQDLLFIMPASRASRWWARPKTGAEKCGPPVFASRGTRLW